MIASVPEYVQKQVAYGNRTAIVDKTRLGHAGDTFELDGILYEVVLVRKIPMREAVCDYCLRSGYNGPWPMAVEISRRCPELGWDDPVFVHVIKAVSEGCL